MGIGPYAVPASLHCQPRSDPRREPRVPARLTREIVIEPIARLGSRGARLLVRRVQQARARFASRLTASVRRALPGRTVLVTGATGAIGAATAEVLLGCGATVLLHGRSADRLDALATALAGNAPAGARLATYAADLCDGAAVAQMAARIAREHPVLDGLINNAGIGYVPQRRVDAQGRELVWSTNVIAPWRLALALKPQLVRSSRGRVVNVVSSLLRDLPADPLAAAGYDPIDAYGRSKQALLLLSAELAAWWRPDGVAVIAVDPGTIDTPMAAGFPFELRGDPPAVSGRLLARMVAEPGLQARSGQWFARGIPTELPAQARDLVLRRRLADAVQALV